MGVGLKLCFALVGYLILAGYVLDALVFLIDTFCGHNDVLKHTALLYSRLASFGFIPVVLFAAVVASVTMNLARDKARRCKEMIDLVPGALLVEATAANRQVAHLLAGAKSEVRKLDTENHKLRSIRTCSERQIAELRKQNDKLSDWKAKRESLYVTMRKAQTEAAKTAAAAAATAAAARNDPGQEALDKIRSQAELVAKLRGDLAACEERWEKLQATCSDLRADLSASQTRCQEAERALQEQDAIRATAADAASSRETLRLRLAKEKLVAETRGNMQVELDRAIESARARWEAEANAKVAPFMAEGRRLHVENQELQANIATMAEQHFGLQQQLEHLKQSPAEIAADHSACEARYRELEAQTASNAAANRADARRVIAAIKQHAALELETAKKDLGERLEQAENARTSNHRSTVAAMQRNAELNVELNALRAKAQEADRTASLSGDTLAMQLRETRDKLQRAEAQSTKLVVVDKKATCAHSCPRHCKMGSRHSAHFQTLVDDYKELGLSPAEALHAAEYEIKEDGPMKWEDSDPESPAGQARREKSHKPAT